MGVYEVEFMLYGGRRESPATVCLSADNPEQAVREAKSTVLSQEPATDILTVTGIRTINAQEA